MNIEEQLAQYRQMFSFQEAKAEENNKSSVWDGELESLKEQEDQDIRDVWASEIESDQHTSFSPTKQDYDAFVNGMMGDERVMKHQTMVEEALNELLSLINSGQLSVEQAQEMMTELLNANVLPDFQDDAPVETKKGRK